MAPGGPGIGADMTTLHEVRRSLAEQDERLLGGPLSILVRQKRDHQQLDRLLARLARSSGSQQDRVLLRVRRLVFPHAFAEESVLWPVVRRTLPDGEDLTLQVEREHQEVNELVTRLDDGRLRGSERGAVLVRLTEVLREDVRDEEDHLLPALQRRLPLWRLRVLGVAWELVRRTAPTRPHPVVSRRPPGNALAALPLTVVDHLRDLCDVLGADRLSAALAGVAGRIERLSPFRSGEHASTARR